MIVFKNCPALVDQAKVNNFFHTLLRLGNVFSMSVILDIQVFDQTKKL